MADQRRRRDEDVADPLEMQQRTVGLLRDDRGGKYRAEPAGETPALALIGIADITACDGIMREKMPTNSSTLTAIAV